MVERSDNQFAHTTSAAEQAESINSDQELVLSPAGGLPVEQALKKQQETSKTRTEILDAIKRLEAEKQKLLDALYLYKMQAWKETQEAVREDVKSFYNDLPPALQKRAREIGGDLVAGPKGPITQTTKAGLYDYCQKVKTISYEMSWEMIKPFSKIKKFFTDIERTAYSYDGIALKNIYQAERRCAEQMGVLEEALRLQHIQLREIEAKN